MTLTNLKYNIAVILPTRKRTTALLKSVTSLLENADDPVMIQIMFGFDDDDESSINYYKENVLPYIKSKAATAVGKVYKRMGYIRLNEYVNDLSFYSNAKWLMLWGDDSIMDTKGWDTEIMKYEGQLKLLAVHTHNEHPYSIFPIIPRTWINITGEFSSHQLGDAWVSQIAYYLGIFQKIPVWATHDRFDLTGNNNDETYNDRPYLEGNPQDPRDINSRDMINLKLTQADKLAWFMKEKGLDISYWDGVRTGKINPWVELKKNDPNNQVEIIGINR